MINLVIALDCEARPLIEHFALKRQQDHALPLYTGSEVQLIVSGVGKLNAAMATGYLAGLTPRAAAWLNIGIAGHPSHDLGSSYLAHKIIDHPSGQSWYPAFTFKPGLPTETLCTFETPVNEYHDGVLHDMEAAGYYQAASRFNSTEFIHCLKLVSDNAEQSSHKINKKMVTDLIAGQIEAIDNVIGKLNKQCSAWNQITAAPSEYEQLLQGWHFSTYQRHQLKQLLKRWSTLHPQQTLEIDRLNTYKSSRDVLKYLQDTLDITATS